MVARRHVPYAALMTGSQLRTDERRLDRIRDQLGDDERELLVLRVHRALDWEQIAAALSSDGVSLSPERVRRRFERLRLRIANLARTEGLLER
jgi:RNA polymerase sigma-70 factor (ECF subfamily)